MKTRALPLTKKSQWDNAWSAPVKSRLPSRYNAGVRNITRLIESRFLPGSSYIEIGCAPGKFLVWVAEKLAGHVAGIDYSPIGIEQCEKLFEAFNVQGPLYCADILETVLPDSKFDFVASFGLIEHFDDPLPVIQKHIDLAKDGGVVLITVPNYGGIYGALQHRCDPENLTLHNLSIMNIEALAELAASLKITDYRAYTFGTLSPWLVSLEKKFPKTIALSIQWFFNCLGLIQPWPVPALSPLLVLEIRK